MRKKTGEYYSIPLFDIVIEIINKYDTQNNHLLPQLSQQQQNSRLKDIGNICELKKKLTTHVARHTCATFMLRKGVPLKIISEILGHTKLSTTEVYAKLERDTIAKELDKIKKPGS